ncbi:MAG: MATE family efflux transporter [Planctomycetales bacterium]|nr:MATE family efflux transporter [Planctomycetales bacterium]NIM08517.1 MATE family efflux transporter [Planctomycetales bacterium]NIN07991.1 MATE family efflux transporter [Planctomycetales bacterium]NIN77120.1 MATE family efflux transporter [Planctomycetales bacterium]NIO34304.1 MATE family efflux transporter [Planctomycetales bacterium]
MLRLVFPVLAEQLLHALVMLVDVWLAGNILKEAPELAAIGLMAYTMWFLTGMFDFVNSGATALTARFVGAGNLRRAQQITCQAVVLGGLVAVGAMVIGYLTARPFVTAMRLQPDAADLAVRYIHIILPVLPAIMLQRVGIACLRGAGDMVTVFWVMSVVNLVNIGVSCWLVIGGGPVSPMGWDGIALGTAAAHVTGGLLVLGTLLRGRGGLRLYGRWLRPDRKQIGRLLRIGIPGGTDTVSIIACHMGFVAIINALGNEAAAAHNVAIRLESLAFLPGAAFSLAATTMAGQYLGAGDSRRADRGVMLACATACGIMLTVGLLFFFGGRWLADIFLDPQQTAIAQQAASLLRIASYAMLPLALHMVLSGALRGAGDTRWPLLFTLVGMLGIRIPIACLLTPWYGVAGAWWAMLIDISLRCLMVVYRFRHGGWKRTVV